MQDLTSDIEELLQRASAEYPLKTGADKWDEIADKISQQPVEPTRANSGSLLKKYGAILLLMLFAYLTLKDSKTAYDFEYGNSVNEVSQGIQSNHAADKNIPTDHLKLQQRPVTVSKFLPASNIKKDAFRKGVTTSINSDAMPESYNENSGNSIAITNELKKEKITDSQRESELSQSKIEVPAEIKSRNEITVPLTSEQSGWTPKNKILKRGFYYGLEGGIGLNAIKDQGFSKLGYKAGLIAGYRLNSFLSIESGLSFSKKYYNTMGKYFSMDEMHKTNPSVSEIMDVRGSSNLLEFPVVLRYDIFPKNNRRIFSTIGLSTYIMTLESNHYNVKMNGSSQHMYGAYRKAKIYYTASFDFGFGFEKDISNKTHVRLAPYVQLPISGIGIGRLPVKTAGIRIGISRSLH